MRLRFSLVVATENFDRGEKPVIVQVTGEAKDTEQRLKTVEDVNRTNRKVRSHGCAAVT